MTPNAIRTQEQRAVEYLAPLLGPRAPAYLSLAGEFDETPLEGEGRTWLFSFDLTGAGCPPGSTQAAVALATNRKHYVAVGETEPNYFPAFGLNPDDAYSFHIGTRFMLVMGVGKVDPELEPPGARAALERFVAGYAAGAALEHVELAGLFRNEDDYFAVYRLRLGGQEVYCMGADCPPGFYPLTQHPPQTALRLHLGKVIRAEAAEERRRSS